MKIALMDFGFLQCIGTQMGFLQPESHVLIRCTMQLSLAGCNTFMWDFVGECIIYSLLTLRTNHRGGGLLSRRNIH